MGYYWETKMTFKELAEQILKDNPRGIWVHFNDDIDERSYSERYLDEYSLTDFKDVLDKEVNGYFIDDECDYEVLEVFF